MSHSLRDPVELPCGLIFPNRVIKAALAEQMTRTSSHEPDERFEIAYRNWGSGGWGAILTGNVQIDEKYSGAPADVVLGDNLDAEATKQIWRRYADAVQCDGTPGIVQLNHPGRQSPLGSGTKGFFEKNIAPSAVGMNVGDAFIARAAAAILFGTPRAMTEAEISHVVERFAATAKFLCDVGFKGIEIHAAHGYLLAQFLSSKSNQRTDQYGGSPANRARLTVEIITAIRRVVSKTFAIGIKLNSVDHQQSGDLNDSLQQIGLIEGAGIDFMEISGGSYEDTKMFQDVTDGTNNDRKISAHSSAREAFFIEFGRVVRQKFPNIVLMLTGGFRTRAGMQAAIDENACDLVGLGRVSVVDPHWPARNLRQDVSDEQAQMWLDTVQPNWIMRSIPVKPIGAGVENDFYASQIRRMGRGLNPVAPGQSVDAKL